MWGRVCEKLDWMVQGPLERAIYWRWNVNAHKQPTGTHNKSVFFQCAHTHFWCLSPRFAEARSILLLFLLLCLSNRSSSPSHYTLMSYGRQQRPVTFLLPHSNYSKHLASCWPKGVRLSRIGHLQVSLWPQHSAVCGDLSKGLPSNFFNFSFSMLQKSV